MSAASPSPHHAVTPSVARRGLERRRPPAEWRLGTFAGRFVEISGDRASAALSFVFRLVLEAQRRGEPAVWVGSGRSVFFPPDVADAGIDLGALAVVRTPELLEAARAADQLLRSGAFGVLVLDLGRAAGLPLYAQTRLAGLAKKHDVALLCVTENDSGRPSLGSLISLRAHAARTHREQDRFRCEVRVLKDKRRGPGWGHAEVYRGPDGLC